MKTKAQLLPPLTRHYLVCRKCEELVLHVKSTEPLHDAPCRCGGKWRKTTKDEWMRLAKKRGRHLYRESAGIAYRYERNPDVNHSLLPGVRAGRADPPHGGKKNVPKPPVKPNTRKAKPGSKSAAPVPKQRKPGPRGKKR